MAPIAAVIYLGLALTLILSRRGKVGKELLYGAAFAAVIVTVALVWERFAPGG